MFPEQREAFLKLMENLREHAGFADTNEPIVVRNEEGRLHSDTGPAYRSRTRITWYRDGQLHGLDADYFGSTAYYYRNVMVPQRFFLKRNEITLDEVIMHQNVEVRCVGLEIYGYQRMADEGHLQIVDQDNEKEMVLYRYSSPQIHEPILLVKLKNSTPEKDGSFKYYFLCVPPSMKTCREAVAWTFDRTPEEYVPQIET